MLSFNSIAVIDISACVFACLATTTVYGFHAGPNESNDGVSLLTFRFVMQQG